MHEVVNPKYSLAPLWSSKWPRQWIISASWGTQHSKGLRGRLNASILLMLHCKVVQNRYCWFLQSLAWECCWRSKWKWECPNSSISYETSILRLQAPQRQKQKEVTQPCYQPTIMVSLYVSYLKHFFTRSHLQKVDNSLVTVGSYTSVFVFCVVQKCFENWFNCLSIQWGKMAFICPPNHLFCN